MLFLAFESPRIRSRQHPRSRRHSWRVCACDLAARATASAAEFTYSGETIGTSVADPTTLAVKVLLPTRARESNRRPRAFPRVRRSPARVSEIVKEMSDFSYETQQIVEPVLQSQLKMD